MNDPIATGDKSHTSSAGATFACPRCIDVPPGDPGPCAGCPDPTPSARFYLCGNCGKVTTEDECDHLQRGSRGRLRKSRPGEADPIVRCAVCGYLHDEDDAGPPLYGGTMEAMLAARADLATDEVFTDLWADTAKELRGPTYEEFSAWASSGAAG